MTSKKATSERTHATPGGIKRAFEAGGQTDLELGYRPTSIYGVSVGALNTAFLTDLSFSEQGLSRIFECRRPPPFRNGEDS
jgi:hypothetical protein